MRPVLFRIRVLVAAVCVVAVACGSTEPVAPVAPTGTPSLGAASPSIVRILAFGCGAPALGSGFAVDTDLIVTSGHLVTGRTPDETRVVRPDGSEHRAVLVAFDSDLDLALLRVEGVDFTPVRLLREVPAGAEGIAYAVRGDSDVDEIEFEIDAPVIVNWDGVFRDTESTFHGVRLNAVIKRGDSGSGLFVGDTDVAGLVHSTNRSGIPRGYAVSARQIGDWLDVVDASEEVRAERCA